jgi:hypothetical protein
MTASEHAATFYEAQIKEENVTPTEVGGPALGLSHRHGRAKTRPSPFRQMRGSSPRMTIIDKLASPE